MTSFGYVIPSSSGTDVPDPNELWRIAELADDSSLSHLWVSDHIVWWHPMYDSLTLLGALAARTSRIELGTAVLLLALRHPVIAAKGLASIDRLSGGRLTVGVGVGGEFGPEWDAVGVDRKTRAARTDEMIDALRGLWSPGALTHHGRHVEVDGLDLHPKPGRQIPLWIGGRTDAALRRAATRGDGWMGLFLTPERYAAATQTLDALSRPDGKNLTRSIYVWTSISESSEKAEQMARTSLSGFYNVPYEKLARYAVVGDPERCIERFREFAEAGVEHFAIAPIWPSVSTEPMNLLIEEVLPAFESGG